MHEPSIRPAARAAESQAPRPAPLSPSPAAIRLYVTATVRRDPLFAAGAVALAAAIALTLLAPPTLLSVALGPIAVIGLSRHPRLGLLPAALLALIAIPYGRAAEIGLASVAGVPLRFHDGVVVVAGLVALLSIRRATLRPVAVRLTLVWVVVGAVALVIGVGEGLPARDVVRDTRWWLLYAFIPLAIWSRASRPAIVRAVLAGATIFTVVLFATAALPAFPDALRDRAMAYDRGLLRLQFSNSVFVVVAIAWLVDRLLRRPAWPGVAWLLLLATGVFLSLTRMSILALLGVVGLSVALAVSRRFAARSSRPPAKRSAFLATLLAVPVLLAFGAFVVGASIAGDESPFDRIFFQGPNAGLDSIVRGRGETYLAALEIIAERPFLGHGLGTLVEFNFTPGGSSPSTPGMQPGVDNAYQTVAMKAGLVGAAAFTFLIGWPFVELARRRRRSLGWFMVAWLAVLALTATQSFATAGYGPFGLAMLIALPSLAPIRARPTTTPP